MIVAARTRRACMTFYVVFIIYSSVFSSLWDAQGRVDPKRGSVLSVVGLYGLYSVPVTSFISQSSWYFSWCLVLSFLLVCVRD